MDADVRDLIDEGKRFCTLIDKGVEALRQAGQDEAEAEFKLAKATETAWAEAPEGTIPEREAYVEGQTAQLQRDYTAAQNMRRTAKAALDSRRQQLSYVQSALSAHRSEAEFANYGPERSP